MWIRAGPKLIKIYDNLFIRPIIDPIWKIKLSVGMAAILLCILYWHVCMHNYISNSDSPCTSQYNEVSCHVIGMVFLLDHIFRHGI
jgi:hypothetical protein